MALAALAGVQVGPVNGADAPAPGRLRVLLTYGGHGFDEPLFFGMLDSVPGIVYTKAQMPEAAERLKPGLEKEYEVIVMYDMVRAITSGQQKAFVALLNTGIGLVSLHHNLLSHNLPEGGNWEEFHQILGAQYLFKELTIDGRKFGPSTWALEQEMKVTVADRTHPITAGVDDFRIVDECYGNYYIAPDVKVLLTTDYPKNSPAVAWVKTYGKSRVFYLQFGHDPSPWHNPNYVPLLANGIRWAAGR